MQIYITPETKKPVDKDVIDLLDEFIGEHESLIQEMIEFKKLIAELEKVYSDVKEIENNNLTFKTTYMPTQGLSKRPISSGSYCTLPPEIGLDNYVLNIKIYSFCNTTALLYVACLIVS
jgi:hypothetical protein